MTILTRRLRLTPLTPRLLRLQLRRNPFFFKELNVRRREDWPPPLYDGDAMTWTLDRLEAGENPRWHTQVLVTRAPLPNLARVVGVAGFKGPPDEFGEVEIGYSIVASEQRRGFAREAVDALIAFAFGHESVAFVSAHTLSGEQTRASRRVLEGANFFGPISTEESDVVRYELVRESLRAANQRVDSRESPRPERRERITLES